MARAPGSPDYQQTDAEYPHLGGNIRGGDPLTFYPETWKYIISRFGIKSVLDIGCGEGYSTKFFRETGCHAIGLDGLRVNVDETVKKGCSAILLDLEYGYCRLNVDLIWCCEVVEHIKERCLDNLLMTMSSGRIIAMTHALPGQDGWHHVNCKPAEYWLAKMSGIGYDYLPNETDEARRLAFRYFQISGFIFSRKTSA